MFADSLNFIHISNDIKEIDKNFTFKVFYRSNKYKIQDNFELVILRVRNFFLHIFGGSSVR